MNDADSGLASALAFFAAYGIAVLGVAIATVILTLVVNWRIAAKAGYSGGLSLLLLIPFVNVAALIIFAFSEWPIERELAAASENEQLYHPPVQIR
jgi:hypothetical protein